MTDQRWSAIEKIVRECKRELFDIELPHGPNGVMRVFITGESTGGVTKEVEIGDCARVSRLISPLEGESSASSNGLVPEGVMLEVSSPGINRRLRRPEHFQAAVGQRIRITVDPALIVNGRPERTVLAQLLGSSGSGSNLTLSLIVPKPGSANAPVKKGMRKKSLSELPHEEFQVNFKDIQSARVDFDFDNAV